MLYTVGKVIKFPTNPYIIFEKIPIFAGVIVKNAALPDIFRIDTLI